MPEDPARPILLLVEDEEDDAFFFERAFKKSATGFSLHHVSNGSAALEYLRNAARPNLLPRIMFLDLKMPALNGFDVLGWMQKQTFPLPIPVVVLSGSEQQKDKDRAYQLGAAHYLVKPVTSGDLDRILQNIFPSPKDATPTGTGEQL